MKIIFFFLLSIPIIMDTQVDKPLQNEAPLAWGSVEAVVGLIDTAMAGGSEGHILPQLAVSKKQILLLSLLLIITNILKSNHFVYLSNNPPFVQVWRGTQW